MSALQNLETLMKTRLDNAGCNGEEGETRASDGEVITPLKHRLRPKSIRSSRGIEVLRTKPRQTMVAPMDREKKKKKTTKQRKKSDRILFNGSRPGESGVGVVDRLFDLKSVANNDKPASHASE